MTAAECRWPACTNPATVGVLCSAHAKEVKSGKPSRAASRVRRQQTRALKPSTDTETVFRCHRCGATFQTDRQAARHLDDVHAGYGRIDVRVAR